MSYSINDFEQVNDYRVHADSLINLSDSKSFLFLGVGYFVKTIDELLTKGGKILCNDILKPEGINLPWISSDLRKLDYPALSKEYDTLVTQQLCNGLSAKIIFESLTSGIWDSFTNIVLELCNNEEHYEFAGNGKTGIINHAGNCKDLLNSKGYHVRQVYTEDERLSVILYASKKKTPNVLNVIKPASNEANGFGDSLMPKNYRDGNDWSD